jgi:thioesterase domain-containing protein
MTKTSLAKILKKQIPLSNAMGIHVVKCSRFEGVQLRLPLKPNRNHKNTAFGGTLVAAQALASWAAIMAILEDEGLMAEVVIQRQFSEFIRPVKNNFSVKTHKITSNDILRFCKILRRFGKARIEISACVMVGGKLAATFKGEYVAINVSI